MQNHDCALCSFFDKDVAEEPCWLCTNTPYKKYFEPIKNTKTNLANDIREKLVIYKVLKQQFNSGYYDDILNLRAQINAIEKDISKILFPSILSGDILLYTKGENNGKPSLV